LQNLESEQLPKLKSKFSLPSTPNNEKKKLIEQQNEARFIPPMLYSHSISQQSLSNENQTPTKKQSSSEISNQSNRNKQLIASKVTNSTTSHRGSVTSIRSNSDEENRNKFILEETINPKRPLRPKTQTSTSTGSNSAHNSRPVSHVSDDGQLTLLPNNLVDLNFYNNHNILIEDLITSTPKPPPPKQPKPSNITLNLTNKIKQQDSST
jgi:hypothetical protein